MKAAACSKTGPVRKQGLFENRIEKQEKAVDVAKTNAG
jgi:hypothetical protein